MPRVPKHRTRRLKVGDRVRIEIAGHTRLATVIEDRGNLGAGGAPVVRIDVDTTSSAEPYRLDVPADWLKPTAA